MRVRLPSLLLGGGVIAVVLAVSLPASADPTWTVTGGTSWTASLASGTTVTLTDITSNTSFTCPESSGKGTIENGTGLSGKAIGAVTSSTFGLSNSNSTMCHGSFGSAGVAAQLPGVRENIDALSYNSTIGVTTGDVSNVDVILSFSDFFGTCTAEITGTANFTYTNSTALLNFTNTGSLTVKSTNNDGRGCTGVIAAGDRLSYSTGAGGYQVSPRLTITSP